MARRARSTVIAEPRGSANDPRVRRVPVHSRALLSFWVGHSDPLPTSVPAGAVVWVHPRKGAPEEQLRLAERHFLAVGAERVVVLPRDAEDAALPAEAGSPAPSHDAASIREAVAELVAELPEAVREPAGARVERLLSEAGL